MAGMDQAHLTSPNALTGTAWAGQHLTYVEIGVPEGRRAVRMLEHILTHMRSLRFGIDCSTQTKQRAAELVGNARRNLARFGRKAVLRHGSSLLALSKLPVRPTFDIAYIDGDHSALGAALDTCLVWPIVMPGGIVAFDDWTHPRFRTFTRLIAALLGEVPHEVLVENELLWVTKSASGPPLTVSKIFQISGEHSPAAAHLFRNGGGGHRRQPAV